METKIVTLKSLAWVGVALFLVIVIGISAIHRDTIFFRRHGWSHRLLGGLMLLWLFLGVCSCHICSENPYVALIFDVILGILGICTTVTAAKEFPHKYIQNEKGQSGTLHQKAIVTQSEMIEHAFYQTLNLIQAIYLHMMYQFHHNHHARDAIRLGLLFLVSSPWLIRQKVPIHSFSDNWKVAYQHTSRQRQSELQQELEVLLYRIKKGQYLFYKHVILHGINIYMAVVIKEENTIRSNTVPPHSLAWRIFWLLLNTSYVMEFFLQSLVKRKTIIRQSTMLWLQRWLMASASIGAVVVLWEVIMSPRGNSSPFLLPVISLASLTLNFTNRHHDVLNTMIIACVVTTWNYFSNDMSLLLGMEA